MKTLILFQAYQLGRRNYSGTDSTDSTDSTSQVAVVASILQGEPGLVGHVAGLCKGRQHPWNETKPHQLQTTGELPSSTSDGRS